MSDTRLARLAARLVAEEDARSGAVVSTAAVLAGDVAAVERALLARGRRAVLVRVGVAVAAVATIAMGALGLASLRSTPGIAALVEGAADAEASVVRASDRLRVVGVTPLEPGDRVESTKSAITVSLSTGSRLELGRQSELELVALERLQRFSLKRGQLALRVAKLEGRDRFIVAAGDVEVEVRGTAFTVGVDGAEVCPAGPRAYVSVSEGHVTVRRRDKVIDVRAGESWESAPPCVPPPLPAAEPAAVVPEASPSSPPEHKRATRRLVAHAHVPAAEDSDLAAQNELFRRAVAAEKRGDDEGAAAAFDELVARFPQGSLAPSARAARRALQGPPSSPVTSASRAAP